MIAICPPEYFPRNEYMSLMMHVDKFIVADTFRYRRQTFQNRAKIRTPVGFQWIAIPLEKRQHGTPITEVRLQENPTWIGKHRRALEFNYRSSPYFEFFEDKLWPVFEGENIRLSEYLIRSMRHMHELLELKTELVIASELPDKPDSYQTLLEASGEETVLVLPEMEAYLETQLPSIEVFNYEEKPYRQNFDGFTGGLSGLDLLYNYGSEAVTQLRPAEKLEQNDTNKL